MPGIRQRKKLRDRDLSHRRRDDITRLVVDLGINYLSTLGLEKATQFLRDHDVPETVTARVFSSPQSRRTTD